MRPCRTCHRPGLTNNDFYKSTPGECKECRKGRTAASRQADPETMRRYGREAYRAKRAQRIAGLRRVCKHCGGPIGDQKAAHAKYCCRGCSLDAGEAKRKAELVESRRGRLCERCGDEIPPTRTLKAVTCSVKCRDALNERSLMHRKCRALSHYALKVGRLVRQPCEICGSPDVEMHHVDYFDPLDVRWLCFLHHRTVMHGQQIQNSKEETR